MKKYAKIIDKETKQCEVGIGTNTDFYESIGMTEMDVEQAWNGFWYVEGYAPEKPAPIWEEIDQARIEFRRKHIDDRTIARMRKTANGTWTEQDEEEYLALDEEMTEWIEEILPYPVGEE